MSRLRVVHLSTTDLRGGAAICAHRLHGALRERGVFSRMLVGQRFGRDPDVLEYNALAPAPASWGRAFFRLARHLQRPALQRDNTYFTFDRAPLGLRLPGQVPACDVLNLHWTSDLLDFRVLPRLLRQAPAVWTLHDMNPFTGGCHYSGGCERHRGACGSCPQLTVPGGEGDRTRRSLDRKRAALLRVPAGSLAIVTPSRWLANEARGSSLFQELDVRVIPNAIDGRVFRPVDRAAARARFGLPPKARVVLFVADFIGDRRKGLEHVLQAAAALRDFPDLLFVTIGRGATEVPVGPGWRHLGALHGSDELAAAYSAADVFVIPSLQDNFPNTVLEAMACATPVVGFRVGGIPDMVLDGQTGLLAPGDDGLALAPLLRRLLAAESWRRQLGGAARQRVEQEYAPATQAGRYAELYAEMREGRCRRNPEKARPALVSV